MVMDPSTVESVADEEEKPSAARSAAAEFHDMQKRVEEIGRYLRYMVSLKKERLVRGARRAMWLAAAGVLGAVVALSLLAAAAVLLCVGIALALNRAFESAWAGPLITGLGILVTFGAGFVVAMRVMEKKTAAAMRQRHAVERAELKLRYGRGFDE